MTSLTEADWTAILEAAVSPTPVGATEPQLRVKTADEIVAEACGDVPSSSAAASLPRATTTADKSRPAEKSVVFSEVPSTPVPQPMAASTSDSAELIELRAIRHELEMLNAAVATAINKMPTRK
jgi:hypothetical protein